MADPKITFDGHEFSQNHSTHRLVWDEDGNYKGQYQPDALSDSHGEIFINAASMTDVVPLTLDQKARARFDFVSETGSKFEVTIKFTMDRDRVPGWGYRMSDWEFIILNEFLRQSHYNAKAEIVHRRILDGDDKSAIPKWMEEEFNTK